MNAPERVRSNTHPGSAAVGRGWSPFGLYSALVRHRGLLLQFTRREVERRYKGTVFGMFWSFLNPLLLLTIYWVVFGLIFKASYGNAGETSSHYVLSLFCGLLLWELLASAIVQAPGLMLSAPNLITKVVFPVEIIPIAAIGSALVHVAIGFIPLLVLQMILLGGIPLSALGLIAVVVPVSFYALGLTYALSSLGVFLRDLGTFIPPLVTALMFGSALFFPISAVPVAVRSVVALNPIAVLLEQARNALVFGVAVDLITIAVQIGISFLILMFGYAIFTKLKPAFADVI